MGYMVDNFLANAKECVKWKKSSLDEGGVGLKDRTSVWGSKKKKKMV
jgi:hypothetical protein